MTLVILLVATAALIGASGAASNTTVAGRQATRDFSTAENVGKFCLKHEGAAGHDGAQHDAGTLGLGAQLIAGPPLPPLGTPPVPYHVSPTAEHTPSTSRAAADKTTSCKATATPLLWQLHEQPLTTCTRPGASPSEPTETEMNPFGARPRPTPSMPVRVAPAASAFDTAKDAAETKEINEPTTRPFPATNTAAATGPGAAATGSRPVAPGIRTTSPARARRPSAPRHVHTSHHGLSPKDTVTTSNNTATTAEERRGSSMLPLRPSDRDDDKQVRELSTHIQL